MGQIILLTLFYINISNQSYSSYTTLYPILRGRVLIYVCARLNKTWCKWCMHTGTHHTDTTLESTLTLTIPNCLPSQHVILPTNILFYPCWGKCQFTCNHDLSVFAGAHIHNRSKYWTHTLKHKAVFRAQKASNFACLKYPLLGRLHSNCISYSDDFMALNHTNLIVYSRCHDDNQRIFNNIEFLSVH